MIGQEWRGRSTRELARVAVPVCLSQVKKTVVASSHEYAVAKIYTEANIFLCKKLPALKSSTGLVDD